VDYLGFHINYKYDAFFFVKAPNGSMLEIIPSEGEYTAPKMKDRGIRHLAIAVDDFDAAHEDLISKGVKFLTEPYNNQGNRLVFFEDGDGNIVHLIHREKPLP
jgi:glyoxylase I family protein